MSDPALEQQAHQAPQEQAPGESSQSVPTEGATDSFAYPELESDVKVGEGPEAHSEDVSDFRPVPRVAIQAFCETESVANTIDYTSRDRRMSKAHVKVQLGGIAAAVEFYQSATTPNLIFVESQLVGEALMGELTKLADVCDEGTNVVVIGHKNDVSLYRDLVSRGVAEYFGYPHRHG